MRPVTCAWAVVSAIDLRLSQLLYRSFGTDRRIINLLESVGARLGRENRHDFDMPVVVVVDGLPIAERCRGVQAVGRGVQHQMEPFRDRANPLQGAAQKRGKISPQSRFRQASALE